MSKYFYRFCKILVNKSPIRSASPLASSLVEVWHLIALIRLIALVWLPELSLISIWLAPVVRLSVRLLKWLLIWERKRLFLCWTTSLWLHIIRLWLTGLLFWLAGLKFWLTGLTFWFARLTFWDADFLDFWFLAIRLLKLGEFNLWYLTLWALYFKFWTLTLLALNILTFWLLRANFKLTRIKVIRYAKFFCSTVIYRLW